MKTENEWASAVDAHHNRGEEYIIYRIANARTKGEQKLADVFWDPCELRKSGQLSLITNDFWVRVGRKT